MRTPITPQTEPIKVIIANINLLMPITFIKKKYEKSPKLGLVNPSRRIYIII